MSISTPEELRLADHKAVIAWERVMREVDFAASLTIRRRWFVVVLQGTWCGAVTRRDPIGEVKRPAINRDEGSTPAFPKTQARMVLDAPWADTIAGRRDHVGERTGS